MGFQNESIPCKKAQKNQPKVKQKFTMNSIIFYDNLYPISMGSVTG